MRGATLKGYGEPLEIEEHPTPEPGPDDVVIDVEACGICRSDWHAWHGDYGWLGGKISLGNVLGHEPAGTIVEVGDSVENWEEGDEVLVPFNIICGRCEFCRDGRAHMCENIRSYGFVDETPGAFATHLRVPDADFNLVEQPPGADPRDMAALGCRYVTAFHALAHRHTPAAGDWVAVHGCGGVGLSAVNVADALGANVVAVDLQEEKLDLAERLGADATINGDRTEDVPGEIAAITGKGAHVSIDALGIGETIHNSIDSLRRTGTHVQLGITTQDQEGVIDIPTDHMLHSEQDFLTAKGMPPQRYPQLFRMMEQDEIQPERLVTNEVGLTDVSDRLEAMSDFGTKGVEVVTDFDV